MVVVTEGTVDRGAGGSAETETETVGVTVVGERDVSRTVTLH